MGSQVSESEWTALPTRPLASHPALAWPVCGRVVDVAGGLGGRPLRCHLSHGHRGECDDLGSSELEYWQARANQSPSQAAAAADVRVIALAHARTYEAVAEFKRERGADDEAGQLMAMADALRRLVQVLERQTH